jgi:hypothetical protein
MADIAQVMTGIKILSPLSKTALPSLPNRFPMLT